MFKKIKPKLIAISIIALIIAGAVNYVYYLTRPLSIIKNPNIPNEFTYNNEKIALAWTDDNEGETLIIKSDKKEYSGFNQTDVYFSVTNISNKDQDADIILWFKDEKGSAKGVERLSDAQNFKFQITNVKSNPNDKIQNNQNAGASGNGYAVNDKIASGETNYYKATIKFPPMSKGEFNIEAVGTPAGGKALRAFRGLIEPKIAYGLLDPWYSSSWSYRRAITLQGSKIATTTTGFPVLATTTLADLKTTTNGGKVGNSNGYDIVFTDSDGSTMLNYEREKYVASTGEIAYWIKTDIASSTDKTIYMYYGNAGASDTATTTGVWDSNYVMVNHLANNGVATTTYPDFLDSTKYANNGSSVNMNSADLVNGQVDGALDFDGVNDYVRVLNNNILNANLAITVCAWAKINDQQWTGIISKGTETDWNAGLGWALTVGNGGRIRFNIGNNSYMVISETNSVYDNSIFHYIVGRWNGGTIDIFIDGKEVQYLAHLSATNSADSTSSVRIGNYVTTAFFNGLIDETRISNTARTAGWITTEWNNQSSVGTFLTIGAEERGPVTQINSPQTNLLKGGLVGYWSFNGQNMGTTSATDLSGNNNTGWLMNGVKKVEGISGQGLSFDGVDDYVDVNDSSSLDITNKFTISTWIKPKSIGTNSGSVILFKWEDSDNSYFFRLIGNNEFVDGKSYCLRIGFKDTTNTTHTFTDSTNTQIPLNTWSFVSGQYDGTYLRLFLNGVELSSSIVGVYSVKQTNDPIWIGRQVQYANDNSFNGFIDEVRIYNRALSAEEIGQLYRAGARKVR